MELKGIAFHFFLLLVASLAVSVTWTAPMPVNNTIKMMSFDRCNMSMYLTNKKIANLTILPE